MDGEFFGPESIAHRKDEVYTGVTGGKILRIKNGKITTVAQIGTKCGMNYEYRNELLINTL